MSLESLIEKVAATKINGEQVLINNLFQSQAYNGGLDRDWQANLRTETGTSFFEFGRGATPTEALQVALDKAISPTVKSNDMPKFLPKAHVEVKALNVEDLF